MVATEDAVSSSTVDEAWSCRDIVLEWVAVIDVRFVADSADDVVSLRHMCSCRLGKGNATALTTCSRACSVKSGRVSKRFLTDGISKNVH